MIKSCDLRAVKLVAERSDGRSDGEVVEWPLISISQMLDGGEQAP